MPENDFKYTMIPFTEDGFFWVTFFGEISLGRLAKAHNALTSHAEYVPGIDELLDFSQTSVGQITRQDIDQIRAYMETQPDRHHNKSVIVVNTELEYGLGRMMGAWLDRDVPVERQIVYSVREALDWLRPGKAAELEKAHQQALKRC